MKYLLVFLIPIISIVILIQCNSKQELTKTSWCFFEVDPDDEKVYSEVSFGKDLTVCFHTEDIQTCRNGKLDGNILYTSYDSNFKQVVDTMEIVSLSKDKMIIKNSENQEIILSRLDYQSIGFMQTDEYDSVFEKRMMRYKINNQ